MKKNWKKGAFEFWGTNQQSRISPLLLPENIRIDPRDLPGFLSYAYHAARSIQYYDRNNEPAGNWTRFLEKDPSVLIALVLDNRTAYWDEKARNIFKQYYTLEEDGRSLAFTEIIATILEMALLLNSWYQKSKQSLLFSGEIPLHSVLEQAIRPNTTSLDSLSDKLQQLKGIIAALTSEKLIALDEETVRAFVYFDPAWGLSETGSAQPLKGNGNVNKLNYAMEMARQCFQKLLFTMRFIEEKAPGWFKYSLEYQHNHTPQNGLVLAYLHLLLHVQEQLNEKPQEHLIHYYQDILQQQFIPHIPDRAIVCLQAADHVPAFLLEKNTALSAGVDDNGLATIYRTTEDLLITQTRIAALKTVYVAKKNMMKGRSSYKLISGVYAAPVANSKDGLGTELGPNDRNWPILGTEQLDLAPSNRNMVDAEIGFVIASPILLLQEGERTIQLHFRFTPTSMARFSDFIEDIHLNTGEEESKIIHDLFDNALLVDVSTADGWFRVKRHLVDITGEVEISLTLFLSEIDPGIVGNNPEKLGQAYDSTRPLIRVLLNPDTKYYLYSFILPLEVETLRIETHTKGLQSLILRSNAGLLDASMPFMPFGPVPMRNSFLLIGSAELFRKRLTALTIEIQWNNVPEEEGGFKAHYQAYGANIDNQSFKIRVSALSNGRFSPLDPARQEVFNLFDAASADASPETRTDLELQGLTALSILPDYNLEELPEYSVSARIGYFKLQLSEPSFAFGHLEYPRLFTQYMLAQAKGDGILGSSKKEDIQLPKEPFVPVINRISVSYKAATLINLRPMESDENDLAADEKIFSIHPFGTQLIFAEGTAREHKLFPIMEEDAYLYIGLENAKASRPLTLFFNIRESEAGTAIIRPNLMWSYLQGERWEPFSEADMVYDTTRGFTTTGIVKLRIPDEIVYKHTILPAHLFWLRVSASGNLEVIGAVSDIQLNAVETVWEYNGDDGHFDASTSLPPIQELAKKRTEIASLTQVTGFYGGRGIDQLKPFYVRTSERLRHKNRGISAWDIERLVLEAFPEVHRVKCVTWMEYDEIRPGSIHVIVIPKAPEENLEPKLGFHQLDLIYDFLKKRVSPFVNIKVMNPVYEKVKITCSILLEKGLEHEKGKYIQLLHEALLHFICPWLRKTAIHLGSTLSKNEVMVFIKNLPYVRFVTQFSMVQIYNVEGDNTLLDTAIASNSDSLQGSTPWSVLTPVAQHLIQFIDKETYILPEATAIEQMRMGTDFIILEDPQTEADISGLQIYPDAAEPDEWYLMPDTE